MDNQCKNKLLSCRTYAEAKPILETLKVSASGHELAHTAFSIASKQPTLRDQFLGTVIREAEDIEDEDTDKKKELPTKETDGGTSNQSSNAADPLPKIGSEGEAPEGAPNQPDKKDQMGVSINEMAPMPFQQGYPPPMAGAAPPAAAPPAASPPPAPAPQGQMPPMQPKPPAPPQQNMQYIQEAINYGIRQQVAPQFNKMVEAIKQLNTNIQEMTKENVRSLEVGSTIGQKTGHAKLIRETVDDDNMTPEINLGRKRQDMADYNEGLDSGIYQ